MPREASITIQRDQLEGLKTAPDLTQVQVLINGVAAAQNRAERDVIIVEAPRTGDGPWIVLLTTRDGKKLLHALDLSYDPEAETFDIEQQQGLGQEEPDQDDEGDKAADNIAQAIRDAGLGDKLDNAADKIAAAIREAARALSSNASAEHRRNK